MHEQEFGIEHQSASRDFQYYEHVLSGRNENHPQHQGLLQEEFENALRSPNTVTTKVETQDGIVRLPHLVPVSEYEWLNKGRYEREFPDAYQNGAVLHYTDMPSVEPGEEVQEALRELADKDGVLVFDYPTNDPEYPGRVTLLLDQLGIKRSNVQLLATQNYYAGQTVIKNPIETDGIKNVYETAKELGRVGLVENGPAVVDLVSEEDAQQMLEFYDAAYQDLKATEFCNQALSPEEFMHIMTEDESVPKVVNVIDGKIVSLMLVENDLTKLTWINPSYYERTYPDKHASDQIFWFPGLAAAPSAKGVQNTKTMVSFFCELSRLANNDYKVVFDCGIINSGRLDKFLDRIINATPTLGIEFETIAQQNYCAIELGKKA